MTGLQILLIHIYARFLRVLGYGMAPVDQFHI